jgi:hypothetical protein
VPHSGRTFIIENLGDPGKIYFILVHIEWMSQCVAMPRRHFERSEAIPSDRRACVPKLHNTKKPCAQALRRAGTSSRQSGTHRNDTFDKPFTVIDAPRLSDLLLSLPQSFDGKTNTFLHPTNGIG